MLNFFRVGNANAKDDVLSGLTVALALVPEAVAFAFVAGVSPLIGLYSAFFIGLITAALAACHHARTLAGVDARTPTAIRHRWRLPVGAIRR